MVKFPALCANLMHGGPERTQGMIVCACHRVGGNAWCCTVELERGELANGAPSHRHQPCQIASQSGEQVCRQHGGMRHKAWPYVALLAACVSAAGTDSVWVNVDQKCTAIRVIRARRRRHVGIGGVRAGRCADIVQFTTHCRYITSPAGATDYVSAVKRYFLGQSEWTMMIMH